MARKLDWDAKRFAKQRPLISDGEKREFRAEAKALAARIKVGKHKPGGGPVKVYTAEEIAEFERKMK